MIRVTDYFGTFEYYKPIFIFPHVSRIHLFVICLSFLWEIVVFALHSHIKHFSTQFINWKMTTRQNPKTMPWDFTDARCKHFFLKGISIYNIQLYSQISVHDQSHTILWHCSCSNTFVHLSVQIYYAAILKVILSQFFCRKRISDNRKWIK